MNKKVQCGPRTRLASFHASGYALSHMSVQPSENRRCHLARLACYGAGVLGLPMLRRNNIEPNALASGEDGDAGERAEQRQNLLGTLKVPYSQAPLKALKRDRPEFVFIGDSMVRAHIDAAELSKLSGHRVAALWLPNSTSARWYLMLKNYVLRSAVKPKRVVFCFRNCLWHMPTFRVDGPFWDDIERCMPEKSDPVISKVLGPEPRHGHGVLGRLVNEEIYPVQRSASMAKKSMQKYAAKLSGNDLDKVQKATNERFAFQNFRHGITVEAAFEGITDTVPFTTDPAKTFLPHVIKLAKAEGLPLYFVRIKRRPRSGSDAHDSRDQASYIEQMSAYLKAEGCGFYDFSGDPELRMDMYAEGDHLADEHTAWFSRHLFEKIGQEVFA
jgi:hypothetical protein